MAGSLTDSDLVIDHIADSLRSEKLVFFVGAGCSIDSGIPSGPDLAMKLANKFYITQQKIQDTFGTTQPNLEDVAQAIYQEQGKAWVINCLDFESWGSKEPNCVHQIIGELTREKMLQHIVTINYDELIEKGCKSRNHEPIVVRSQLDLFRTNPEKLSLYKIHGCITSPFEVLITKNELEKNYGTWASDQLKTLARSNALVFIGCASPSPILLKMIKQVFSSLSTIPYKPYWVTTDDLTTEAKDLLTACDATSNHLKLSAQEFMFQIQNHVMKKSLLGIFERVTSRHIKNASSVSPECFEELEKHKEEVQHLILNQDIKHLSDMLRLSRIDFGEPYMQLNGCEEKVGRLFFWLIMLRYCLSKLFPTVDHVKFDIPGVHLSLMDEKGCMFNFLCIDSMDDPSSSWSRLRGWLSLLNDGRSSIPGPHSQYLRRPHKLVIIRIGASIPRQPLQVDVASGEPYYPEVIGETDMFEELSANGPRSLTDRLNKIVRK